MLQLEKAHGDHGRVMVAVEVGTVDRKSATLPMETAIKTKAGIADQIQK